MRRIRDLGVSYIEAVRDFTTSSDSDYSDSGSSDPRSTSVSGSEAGSDLESEDDSESDSSSSDYHVYSESQLVYVTQHGSELHQLADEELIKIREWSPPRPLIRWKDMLTAASTGVWHTGFSRYNMWYRRLLKRPAAPGSQDEHSNVNSSKRHRR